MTPVLSTEQIQDVAELSEAAQEANAAVVIIGAIALACFLKTIGRFTNDVDLVIDLDLEDFQKFAAKLEHGGWARDTSREHRLRSARGSRIDLLPAGPALRAAKRIVWPKSQFEMNLTGFDHVFAHAVSVEFAKNVWLAVAPPAIVALLKIVAHLDDRHRRAKDLVDLRMLFCSYEAQADRIFSDQVFAAELEDIEYANAFLLGLDIGGIATPEDLAAVQAFADLYRNPEVEQLNALDDREELRFQFQLKAFQKGLDVLRQQ